MNQNIVTLYVGTYACDAILAFNTAKDIETIAPRKFKLNLKIAYTYVPVFAFYCLKNHQLLSSLFD